MAHGKRIATRTLALMTLAFIAHGTRGVAQSVPVVAVGVVGGAPDAESPATNRVASAIGPSALVGAALAREIEERYGAPAMSGDPLAGARDRVRNAIAAWSTVSTAGQDAVAQQALEAVDAAAREFEVLPEALDGNEENRRSVRRALLFVAERASTAHTPTGTEDAMRRLARLDPAIAFTAREASPPVQQAYAQALAALPRGALQVDTVPAGCRVLRDGRPAGTAPVELQDLAPGEHRISAECGAVHSLVHRVEVAPRTRATVIIDSQLDAAIAGGAVLRYAALDLGRGRLVQDLTRLGRALGARRVYGVMARADEVLVVDPASGTEVGTSPVTDGARLRLLLTQVVAMRSPSPSPAPAPREAITVVHRGGVPPGAVVIGAIGLLALGAGVYSALRADATTHRALQVGGSMSDTGQTRANAFDEANTLRWVEYGGFALGGAMLVTAVFYGLLGRSEVTTVVRSAMLVPTSGGVALNVAGAL